MWYYGGVKVNLKEIKELIKLIDSSSLSEFHLEKDDIKLQIKKESTVKIIKDEKALTLNKEEHISEIDALKEERIKDKEDENLHLVKCPIVGVFYSSPKPDSPPFVKVGDKIKKGDVLCIVEAMKLMNEITSDVDGEVVEILVENQSPVEYGQPLFKIRKV